MEPKSPLRTIFLISGSRRINQEYADKQGWERHSGGWITSEWRMVREVLYESNILGVRDCEFRFLEGAENNPAYAHANVLLQLAYAEKVEP